MDFIVLAELHHVKRVVVHYINGIVTPQNCVTLCYINRTTLCLQNYINGIMLNYQNCIILMELHHRIIL